MTVNMSTLSCRRPVEAALSALSLQPTNGDCTYPKIRTVPRSQSTFLTFPPRKYYKNLLKSAGQPEWSLLLTKQATQAIKSGFEPSSPAFFHVALGAVSKQGYGGYWAFWEGAVRIPDLRQALGAEWVPFRNDCRALGGDRVLRWLDTQVELTEACRWALSNLSKNFQPDEVVFSKDNPKEAVMRFIRRCFPWDLLTLEPPAGRRWELKRCRTDGKFVRVRVSVY